MVQLKGRILPDAKEFVVKLGQDPENLVLHFNPHFDPQKCRNTIVCNSRKMGCGGEEEETHLQVLFRAGGRVQLSFTFLPSEIKVLLDDDHEISFPNWLGLRVLKIHGGGRRLQNQSPQILDLDFP
uniref:galectin-1-like n=1 Tax=Podarcis muralis TaxID=64176 RepID=UPI0010A09DE5|nr:galectin-1-like [Podarcis muralis]